MKSQATKLRILETIDMINYTFKQKPKGVGIEPDKKFLVKLRMCLTGKDTAFLSSECMDIFYEKFDKPRFSKIYDLRFPTAFFSLKELSIPVVLCDLIVGYLGPDEQTCHICGTRLSEKHYLTKKHQNNLKKTNIIPEYLIQAYKNTVRTLPPTKKKVPKLK